MDKQYFLFRGIDGEQSVSIRDRTTAQQRAYVQEAPDVKMIHGGLIYDGVDSVLGTCLILEAISVGAVEDWLRASPFFKAGLFAQTSIERWAWTYGR